MPSLHTRKVSFYLRSFLLSLIPNFIWRKEYAAIKINDLAFQGNDISSRVNYYCKINSVFDLPKSKKKIGDLSVFKEPSAPCYDLLRYLRYFPVDKLFLSDLTDQRDVPIQATFVKCRPVSDENENYVLLKLNSSRFYDFAQDKIVFTDKRNKAIFRGPCHKPHRKEFIKKCYGLPNTDIGDTRKAVEGEEFFRTFTSRDEQLKNKFIISIEGNDVASNLPWIMASNSLAFMTKPKFEGWFMQGRLIPNHHYVLLQDDYSDLEEKIDYYSSNTDEALEIINNAQNHVAQFFDNKRELMISLLVLEKYFRLSGQLE
jgi:hypothetical protein